MTNRPLQRSASAAAIALLVLVAPSCSKDDSAKESSPPNTISSGAVKEFCTFAKETADPADTDRKAVLARFDGLIERAPSEIKPDVESARDFIDATTDPEADPITKSEAALTGQEAFGRLVAYLSATCGMDIDLNSPGSPGSP